MKYIKTPELKKNPAPDCPAEGHCQSYTCPNQEPQYHTLCWLCSEDPRACKPDDFTCKSKDFSCLELTVF